jgi:REP-associated tyrosine transposase
MNFELGFYYHIFNRANSRNELIFIDDDNYRFFLRQFGKYLGKYLDVFTYCILPNHFHFLVKIADRNLPGFGNLEGLNANEKQQTDSGDLGSLSEEVLSKKITQAFSNFLNSYTKSFNKRNLRRGSLFQKNTKVKCIDNEKYLQELIRYIHRNPIKQKLVRSLDEWSFSSYFDYVNSNEDTILNRWLIDKEYMNKEDLIAFTNMDDENYEYIYELLFQKTNKTCQVLEDLAGIEETSSRFC